MLSMHVHRFYASSKRILSRFEPERKRSSDCDYEACGLLGKAQGVKHATRVTIFLALETRLKSKEASWLSLYSNKITSEEHKSEWVAKVHQEEGNSWLKRSRMNSIQPYDNIPRLNVFSQLPFWVLATICRIKYVGRTLIFEPDKLICAIGG